MLGTLHARLEANEIRDLALGPPVDFHQKLHDAPFVRLAVAFREPLGLPRDLHQRLPGIHQIFRLIQDQPEGDFQEPGQILGPFHLATHTVNRFGNA